MHRQHYTYLQFPIWILIITTTHPSTIIQNTPLKTSPIGGGYGRYLLASSPSFSLLQYLSFSSNTTTRAWTPGRSRGKSTRWLALSLISPRLEWWSLLQQGSVSWNGCGTRKTTRWQTSISLTRRVEDRLGQSSFSFLAHSSKSVLWRQCVLQNLFLKKKFRHLCNKNSSWL